MDRPPPSRRRRQRPPRPSISRVTGSRWSQRTGVTGCSRHSVNDVPGRSKGDFISAPLNPAGRKTAVNGIHRKTKRRAIYAKPTARAVSCASLAGYTSPGKTTMEHGYVCRGCLQQSQEAGEESFRRSAVRNGAPLWIEQLSVDSGAFGADPAGDLAIRLVYP